jgi:hypothetical protein
MVWIKLSKIIKITHQDNDLKEFNSLARMIQVSFLAYFSGGIFLSLSYFDLPWHLVSFVVLLESFLAQQSMPMLPPKIYSTIN